MYGRASAGLVKHRLWQRLVGIGLTIALCATFMGFPQPTLATVHAYAGISSSSSTEPSGIRGYIYTSPFTMNNSSNDFVADFVNLCKASCTQWTQTGPYQGHIKTISSPTAVHMYSEGTDGCANYGIVDLGAPPSLNYFYQTAYVGVHQNVDCETQYKYSIVVGYGGNPPSDTRWMSGSVGIPIAETEVYPAGSEPNPTTFFGTNNSHAASTAYAIDIVISGGFKHWTNGNICCTSSFHNDPPYYYNLAQWYSFETYH